MPRPKSPPRVLGPYLDSPSRKYKIRIYDGQSEHDAYFRTLGEAEDGRRAAEKELASSSRRLVDVIDEYLADKQQRGRATQKTCDEQRGHLGRFLSEELDKDITKLKNRQALAIYERSFRLPSRKTGEPGWCRAAPRSRHFLGSDPRAGRSSGRCFTRPCSACASLPRCRSSARTACAACGRP